MQKKVFQNVTEEAVGQIDNLTAKAKKYSLASQKAQIAASSPFSSDVNEAFAGLDEFSYLLSLGLREAKVTRRSLVRDIDFDLYVTEKKRTNYELMKKGSAPYVKDDKNSYIVLHHIGQKFDAPFAELTADEHARFGNSKLLHSTSEDSWRRDPQKEQAFETERSDYWRMRAERNIEFFPESNPLPAAGDEKPIGKDITYDIKLALEQLFSQCSTKDLSYISSLAQSHLMIKEMGASTVDEFLKNTRAESGNVPTCPSCGGKDISFYGSYQTKKERKQRYKCNSCPKVFSSTSRSIIEGSSFSLSDWVKFIDCLYNGYSVEKTAELCGISGKAAFDNRSRLFFALAMLEEKVLLEGNVVIDETYIHDSSKGNRKLQKGFSLARAPRKRGSENHTRGLSKNQVCIACALDEYGVSVAKVAGLGAPSAKKLEEALSPHISADRIKLLHSDASNAIRSYAKRNDLPIRQSHSKKARRRGTKGYETARQIQRINAYHSRLKKFLERFNGVSSDNMQGYASLFSWRDRNREREPAEAYKELLAEMVLPNKYIVMFEQILEQAEQSKEQEKKINRLHFINKQSEEKTKHIYALYVAGVSVKEIAEKFGCTTQAITRRIRNYRSWGLGEKTQKEIAAEEAAKQRGTKEARKVQKFIEQGEYLDRLLTERLAWTGDTNTFYDDAVKRYGRKKQTIKNDVVTAKRVADLRDPFYAGDRYEYMGLREVYKEVFNRYNELRCAHPDLSRNKLHQQLSKEFGYSTVMILNIISTEEKGGINWDVKGKGRTPVAHTLNRDRSVFIDYLNWTGTKKEFLKAAAEEYQVSVNAILFILNINYIADPSRYGMAEID